MTNEKKFMRYSTLTTGVEPLTRKLSGDYVINKQTNSFKEEILPQFGSAQE